jgi:hypothetical protein
MLLVLHCSESLGWPLSQRAQLATTPKKVVDKNAKRGVTKREIQQSPRLYLG